MKAVVGHGRQRRREGQSLIEFALVIPVFLLVLFGLLDIGYAVYVNNALAEGAREGARWGSVQGHAATSAARLTVQSHTLGAMAAVPSATVVVTCELPTLQPVTDPTTCGSGDVLTVTVTSRVTMFTPVIAQLLGPQTYAATSKGAVSQ
jgi:Flp pilus assembly protein TadG